MPLYITKIHPPSPNGFKAWQEIGYLGDYERYRKAVIRMGVGSPIFLRGDFGSHCADCMDASLFLCDYPVGDGKTCDRNMCDEHAKEIGRDLHYCEAHYKMWRDFVEKGGVDEQLKNVVAFKSEK